MIITDFRKKAFKDKVKHIALQRGCPTDSRGKVLLEFNFNNKGDTYPIRISDVTYDDCVAYFRTQTIKDYQTISIPHAITYRDVITLDREIKTTQLIGGEEIKIIACDESKKPKGNKPKFEPQVGDKVNWTYGNGIVIRRTPKLCQVQAIYGQGLKPTFRLDKWGTWRTRGSYSAFYLDPGHLSTDEIDQNQKKEFDRLRNY